MTVTLKTTGIAARCTMCIAVDPDTGLLRDFASAAVTADMTQTGLTISSQSYNGTTRGYWTNGASATLTFGTNKPVFAYVGATGFETFAAFTALEYATTDNAGFIVGDSGEQSGFKFIAAKGMESWRLGNVTTVVAGVTNGTTYGGGVCITRDSAHAAYHRPPGGSTVGPNAADSIGGAEVNFSLSALGRSGTAGTIVDHKLFCVALFRAASASPVAMTQAEFESLADDWFGTLFDVTASGGAELPSLTMPPMLTASWGRR